jgi:hypothetical protein
MNKIIILLFLLAGCILVLFSNKKTIIFEEYFSNNNTIKLINATEASIVIKNISTFTKYTTSDKKLRGIKINEDIHQHYINKLEDWTDSEKQLINWLHTSLIEKTPPDYKFIYNNVKVAKFQNDVENGFPHTNDDTIFVTNNFVANILPYFNNNNISKALDVIGSVIIHECIHIWQRREENFFKLLYKSWNFIRYDTIYNFNKFKKKSRYNPDGVDINWIFRCDTNGRDILPMAVYRDDAKTIGDVNLIGIYCEKVNGNPIIPPLPKIDYLFNITDFTSMFGRIGSNNYHPNELSAEIISIFLIDGILDKNEKYSSLALQKYKTEFNKR